MLNHRAPNLQSTTLPYCKYTIIRLFADTWGIARLTFCWNSELSNNKDTYIKQLQAQWDARPQPLYTQADIKRLCSNYYAREVENDIIDDLQDRPTGKMSPRDWVIKDDMIWKGWDPELSEYFDLPIRFDAEIKFERFYEQLVVSDRESGSCNLL